MRFTGDFNLKTGDTLGAAPERHGHQRRPAAAATTARQAGPGAELPLGHRHGATSSTSSGYYLRQRQRHQLRPAVAARRTRRRPPAPTRPASSTGWTRRTTTARPATTTPAARRSPPPARRTASPTAASSRRAIRQGRYDRDQRASTIRFCTNSNPANGPIVLARRRHRPDARDRLDPADARHAEQDPGHDDDLRAERLQQHVQLVRRASTRCWPASTSRTRSSTASRPCCRPAWC